MVTVDSGRVRFSLAVDSVACSPGPLVSIVRETHLPLLLERSLLCLVHGHLLYSGRSVLMRPSD